MKVRVPRARQGPGPVRRLVVLLLPLAVLLVSLVGVYLWQARQGLVIQVTFRQGHGIRPGNGLRHRGIEVGRVRRVTLAPDLGHVRLEMVLYGPARGLARQGSRFWIVRPRVDPGGIQGLETLVGDNHVAVLPGTGPLARRFTGYESVPPEALAEPGSLEIVLVCREGNCPRAGTPLTFRQQVVGRIGSVALAPDANAVEARALVLPAYRRLIREKTRFYQVPGARWRAGFDGISLDVESVGGLVFGGVALAVPPRPGPAAEKGSRYLLAQEPRQEWLAWQPFLLMDPEPPGLPAPRPARLEARVNSLFHLADSWTRQGLVLPVRGGLVGPADLFTPPEGAVPGSLGLRVDGQGVPLATARPLGPGIAFLPVEHGLEPWSLATAEAWPGEVEDVVVVGPPGQPPLLLQGPWLRPGSRGWRVMPGPPPGWGLARGLGRAP